MNGYEKTYSKKLQRRKPKDWNIADVYVMNDRIIIRVIEKRPSHIGNIRKIEKNVYVNVETGEIYYSRDEPDRGKGEFKSRKSLNDSFNNLRLLINNNFEGGNSEAHIVLTDGTEGMKLEEFNYNFVQFRQKEVYHYPNTDYIAIREMSQNQKWHMHILLKSKNGEELFIPNEEIHEWWPYGWTSINRIKDNNFLSNYFTIFRKELKSCEEEKSVSSKTSAKRSMLDYFPTGSKLYSKSKNILYPEKIQIVYGELEKVLRGFIPRYANTIGIMTEQNGEEREINAIHYSEYLGDFRMMLQGFCNCEVTN